MMNIDSHELRPASGATRESAKDTSPILIVPYMWIGDFVRCHSVVKVLRQRFPDRPVDLLATSLCAPLADYMPGVRQAIVADLPRSRLALSQQTALARRLKQEGYGMALTMPRTWKAALAPFLAGIPERVGFAGEGRFILLNDVRFGEKKLPRMVDRCAMLALPRGAAQPPDWPLPELDVPTTEIAAWRIRRGLTEDRPIVALAPGAVGPSKRWTTAGFSALARGLKAEGAAVWVVGGPGEKVHRHRNRRRGRRARPHRHRFARCHHRARRRVGCGLQRFRAPACGSRYRHAFDRNFRPDQSMALGAAQSAGGRDRDRKRAALPALPQAGLPARSSSLHARHRARSGSDRRARGARQNRCAAGSASLTAYSSNRAYSRAFRS